MKIVQINSFSNGSTGKIMMNIHKELQKQGFDSYVVWGRGRKSENNHEIYLNDKIGVYFHALYARLTGKVGFASKRSTKKLLKRLDEIKPDIIHLHNIHGYYINIELLFNYIRENNIKVIWTLHDCWSFTGQCPYFTFVDCSKWKTQCDKCPMLNEYPKTLKDNSRSNYLKKKKLFTGLNITIVTPSEWLSKLVKQSFLKEYPVKVINNGIDLSIFKPIKSDFRKKYNIENKKIILGVAGVWDRRKGLSDFLELSKHLDNDKYQIVLIGLSKKQLNNLPSNIIGMTRTENQRQLVEIYSASDVLLNPTYEDNYPTVNIEALACGTAVLSYDTGGSIEFVKFIKNNDKVKYIIKKNDIVNNVSIVKNYINTITNSKLNIIDLYLLDERKMNDEYLKLYEEE